MATLRLFAQAREAAGVGALNLPGSTVQGVLDAASDKFGSTFAEVLTISNVWLNGDQTALDASVTESDEVAVLPPVSGG